MDADLAERPGNSSSSSEIIVKVNGLLVFWSSKRPTIIPVSTAEAKCIALFSVGKTVIWLCLLFIELFNDTKLLSILHV